MVDRFQAAIPGQSLTDTPGNMPWEHPPQYTDPKDALEFVYNQCMAPSNLKNILVMLKSDVPCEAIMRTILYTGFSQGKWTPDLIVLMAKPVLQLLVAIGKRAGIKPIVGMPHRYKKDDSTLKAMAETAAHKAMQAQPEAAPEIPMPGPMGILARPNKA